MIHVWRIGTDTPAYLSDDLSGTGAKITGGRWNSRGNALLYASENIALAALETVVHLPPGGLPFNRYLVRIDIPALCWEQRLELDDTAAPVSWDALPAGLASIQYGDQWIKDAKHPILLVPSTIVPEERNALINPRHPAAAHIKATKLRKWLYDPRFTTP